MLLLLILIGVGVLGLLALLYWAFGFGPVRWRTYQRAQKQLPGAAWRGPLPVAEKSLALHPPTDWKARLDALAGESHQRAIDDALREKQFEDALAHAHAAANHLAQDPADLTARVVEAGLAETRRLFCEDTTEFGTDAVRVMLARVTRLAGGKPPPEVSFWQALCLAREHDLEGAAGVMIAVCEESARQII